MRPPRHTLAMMGMAICLLMLVVYPAAGVALATALVLTPVLLFGLVVVPWSLWPAADPRLVPAVFGQAELFQRPPPVSIL
ncbi:MAG TPA: hypothetical protein VHZ09_03265 [Acidobacteriaceae bacterium]|nr:hypothetical protein [Acidobacteriaceae bacterium]